VDEDADIPPSVSICVADVLEGLPYPAESFDFIFLRAFLCGLPKASWPKLMAEIMRILAPGGWIEVIEADAIMDPAGPATKALGEYSKRVEMLASE
jgi:ubiquinone/menaquinone biosynthesis C-methylase UbiE